MMLVTTLAGGVAFLSSFGMLHAGVLSMGIRYPLAVLAGYGAFLALLGYWRRRQTSRQRRLSSEVDLDTGSLDFAGVGNSLETVSTAGDVGSPFGGGGYVGGGSGSK